MPSIRALFASLNPFPHSDLNAENLFVNEKWAGIPGGVVYHRNEHGIGLRQAVSLSALTHLVAPIAFLILVLLLSAVLGPLFPHHALKQPADLQFVLVPMHQPAKAPLNPNTHFRARHASRAAGKAAGLTQAPPSKLQAIKPAQRLAMTAKPIEQAQPQTQPTPAQTIKQQTTRPQASTNTSNEPASVDALAAQDFGPYMKDLSQRIKQSWVPPRGNETQKIVVTFMIDPLTGKLETPKVTQSSGVAEADQAAIAAVVQTSPFRPLPPAYGTAPVSIDFTFDYTLFGDKQGSLNDANPHNG